jgi:hypothetical protein
MQSMVNISHLGSDNYTRLCWQTYDIGQKAQLSFDSLIMPSLTVTCRSLNILQSPHSHLARQA